LIPALLLAAWSAGCSGGGQADPAKDEPAAEFRGAESISESELLKVAEPDLKRHAREPDPAILDDAVFRLVHRYQLEGFRGVIITARSKPEKIVFDIREGPRFFLGKVHFRGNRAIPDAELEALVPRGLLGAPPAYSPRLRALLEDGLVGVYRARGYIDAVVTTQERAEEAESEVHLTFEIVEGRAFQVASIEGLSAMPELEPALRGRVGGPYTPGTVREVEAAVVDFLREHGHPRAAAAVTSRLDRDAGRAVLQVEARPGPKATIGELDISGTARTRQGFVEHRADLERGKPYRASDLRRAEERLAETRIFSSVAVSPGRLQEETGQLTVDVALEEREIAEVAFRGGYGSFEGLRLGADFTLTNLLGGAEVLRLGGNVSPVGFRTEAEGLLPYVAGTEFRLGLSAYYEDREYPSFTAISWGSVPSLSYPLAKPWTVTGGFRRATIETNDVEPGVPPGDLLDFEYSAPFVASKLDLRNNPTLPTAGFLAQAEVAWSPATMGSDVSFVNVSGRTAGYFPLPLGLVAAAALHGGLIDPIGRTFEIPVSLRYFAGGTNSVRGFEFDSIGPQVNGDPTGGELYLAFQSELRFPVWGNFHGAVFSDRGGVWFRRQDLDLDETRYSVGAGLRFYTPAGAVVADVGWNPSPEEDEHPVQLHVTIGFPF
jgi:outer membrane protein assembly complex protein YaeT